MVPAQHRAATVGTTQLAAVLIANRTKTREVLENTPDVEFVAEFTVVAVRVFGDWSI